MLGRRQRQLHQGMEWLLVVTLIGYPIAGLLSSAFDWNSTTTSIPFRAGVLLLSAWVIFRASATPRNNKSLRWLLWFWLLYLIRLIWDWAAIGVPGSLETFVYFVITTLVPCIALTYWPQNMQTHRVASKLVWIGASICAAAVLMDSLQIGVERSLTERTGRLSFEAVNPITLGHVAVTTLIAILCMVHRRLDPVSRIGLTFASVAAGTCLVLAASRGPIVAIAAAAIAFVAATGRWSWLLVLTLLLLPKYLDQDNELLARFLSIDEDESALARLLLQSNAIAQFLNNPLLGSAYIELEFLEYPHNLFIETAMALGVVGLALLLPFLFKTVRCAFREARQGRFLLPLLFVQYFVSAQLSGSIYGNAALWSAVVLLLSLPATPALAKVYRKFQSLCTNPQPPLAPKPAA